VYVHDNKITHAFSNLSKSIRHRFPGDAMYEIESDCEMRSGSKNSKAAGIRDIAEALGTSIGTVDRALHGRSGVSARTKARVLRMAEQLGYKPNIAARSLKLNRNIRIAAVFPRQIAAFFDPLRGGIQAAADEAVGMQLTLDFINFPRLGSGDAAALESAAAKKYDGILFTPGRPRELGGMISRIVGQGIPMICVASDAPDSDRISCITVDSYISGALAAELLSHKLQTPSRVATITGDLATFDHAEKLRGFAATLAMLAPQLTLLPVVESHESAEEAYRQSIALLKAKPHPDAIYISTANSLPVLRALEELKLLGRVQVIATDLFPELVPLLESGKVLATLYQRPEAQGKTALETLIAYLTHKDKPVKSHRFAPHIVLRSNLPLFVHRIAKAAG
jgi:LacI family transcriptional regulator